MGLLRQLNARAEILWESCPPAEDRSVTPWVPTTVAVSRWLEESARTPRVGVLPGQKTLLVAQRFPVISLREITAEDLGSSRKSTIWLLLDPVFGLFPCIFPADLGFAPRDGFATDWALRHLVCGLQRLPARIQV